MRDRETHCRSIRWLRRDASCRGPRQRWIARPRFDLEGSILHLSILMCAVAFTATTMLESALVPVFSQTRTTAQLTTSSGVRLLDAITRRASGADGVGDRGGSRTLAPLRLPSATPIGGSSMQCAEGENLIPNPGFESGDEYWYLNQSVEPTTTEVQSGSMAMRLGASDADAYMDRRISPVITGVFFELSGWGKMSASGETAEIGVQLFDSNGDRLAAEEPPPLTFTSTEFVEQRLTFPVSERIADLYVYIGKDEGTAHFYADSLSLMVCQAPEQVAATPVAPPSLATPALLEAEELAATPATPSTTATPAMTEPAPPIGTPFGQAATPSVSIVTSPDATPATQEDEPLVVYVDSEVNIAVGYPADWRRLTEEEIRAQLGPASDDEMATALATTQLVVVSPDGQAAMSYTLLPRRPDEESLADVVQAVQVADEATVIGMDEITTEALTLDDRDAIRVSFRADDPVTGAAGGRLIRQLITVHEDATIVLAFVVQRDAAARYEETFLRIEESWQRDPRSSP